MIATSAKLREQGLAEKNGADYERTAYGLARLVLDLESALIDVSSALAQQGLGTAEADEALTAVEKLKL